MGVVRNLQILNESPNYEVGDLGFSVPVWIGSDARAPHNNPRIKIRYGEGVPVQLTPTGIEINIKYNQILKDNNFNTDKFKRNSPFS